MGKKPLRGGEKWTRRGLGSPMRNTERETGTNLQGVSGGQEGVEEKGEMGVETRKEGYGHGEPQKKIACRWGLLRHDGRIGRTVVIAQRKKTDISKGNYCVSMEKKPIRKSFI